MGLEEKASVAALGWQLLVVFTWLWYPLPHPLHRTELSCGEGRGLSMRAEEKSKAGIVWYKIKTDTRIPKPLLLSTCWFFCKH